MEWCAYENKLINRYCRQQVYKWEFCKGDIHMDYQKIDGLLVKIKSAYDRIGAETELIVEEPAGIAEVEAIENRLERKLPLQIRDFFLQYSK